MKLEELIEAKSSLIPVRIDSTGLIEYDERSLKRAKFSKIVEAIALARLKSYIPVVLQNFLTPGKKVLENGVEVLDAEPRRLIFSVDRPEESLKGVAEVKLEGASLPLVDVAVEVSLGRPANLKRRYRWKINTKRDVVSGIETAVESAIVQTVASYFYDKFKVALRNR